MQWWVSVSFGLLIIAHIAADKLNLFLLLITLALYIAFSTMVRGIAYYNFEVAHNYKEDLRALIKAGVEVTQVTQGTRFWLTPAGGNVPFMAIAAYGSFFSVMSYLVYSFWRTRRS